MTISAEVVDGRANVYRWNVNTLAWVVWDGSLSVGAVTIGTVNQGTGGSSAWKVDGSAVTQPVSGTFWQATQPVSGPLTDAQLRATPLVATNYFFEISKGNISGASTITKFGYNEDVDAATIPEDIWGQGGVYVAPTAARLHNIASTSASDTAAGTGARTVLLRGIDGSYNAVSETVTLNGVANVATVNSYWHIHLMQVTSGGSGGANVGAITATAQTDGTVTCTVPIGLNQSVSSLYMVPVGYKGYIMKCRARMTNGTANSGATVQLLNKPFGGVFQLKTQMGLNNAGTSFVFLDYTDSTPFIVQAKSMTKLSCSLVTNNNTAVEGEYDLVLIQD